MKELAERVARGRKAIALAKQRGLDTAEWELRLKELLAEADRTPGLPDGAAATVGNPHEYPGMPGYSELATTGAAPTEANLLLEEISTWAGGDPNLWDRFLRVLKRNWQPAGGVPQAPRDLLVAWTAANFRLAEARSNTMKMEQRQYLTRRQRVTQRSLQTDISVNSRQTSILKPWATVALEKDAEAFRILKGICGRSRENKS